jgi:hypothetical protein
MSKARTFAIVVLRGFLSLFGFEFSRATACGPTHRHGVGDPWPTPPRMTRERPETPSKGLARSCAAQSGPMALVAEAIGAFHWPGRYVVTSSGRGLQGGARIDEALLLLEANPAAEYLLSWLGEGNEARDRGSLRWP